MCCVAAAAAALPFFFSFLFLLSSEPPLSLSLSLHHFWPSHALKNFQTRTKLPGRAGRRGAPVKVVKRRLDGPETGLAGTEGTEEAGMPVEETRTATRTMESSTRLPSAKYVAGETTATFTVDGLAPAELTADGTTTGPSPYLLESTGGQYVDKDRPAALSVDTAMGVLRGYVTRLQDDINVYLTKRIQAQGGRTEEDAEKEDEDEDEKEDGDDK